MDARPSPPTIAYRNADPPGAGRYEVLLDGRLVGTVGRFSLGAGQFGQRWVATTPDGRRSSKQLTRDAAAAWLVGQAGVG